MWSCLFAAIPGSLYAVDGVVLIDQNHALAGNITPGDTPGFPVTISQSGSYRLTGNLTVPDANTTAIQITASYVNLDLNGFSIIGPVVCTSTPATCPAPGQGVGVQGGTGGQPSPRGVRVSNGIVRGMGSLGIGLFGGGNVVERITAENNAGGGIIAAGNVFQSSANQNGAFGIFATIIQDSTADENHDVGIQIDAEGGVAIGNAAHINGKEGISSPNGTVMGNTVTLNKGFGIKAVCPSSIVNNTVVANALGTITTEEPNCVLDNNAVR
jgi:hypothetical protein